MCPWQWTYQDCVGPSSQATLEEGANVQKNGMQMGELFCSELSQIDHVLQSKIRAGEVVVVNQQVCFYIAKLAIQIL